jgi:hypothetical protein
VATPKPPLGDAYTHHDHAMGPCAVSAPVGTEKMNTWPGNDSYRNETRALPSIIGWELSVVDIVGKS